MSFIMKARVFRHRNGKTYVLPSRGRVVWSRDANGQLVPSIAAPAPRPKGLPKLVLISRTRSSAHYKTRDGQYEVFGGDLDCTGAVARAHGAGPVWHWRKYDPANGDDHYANVKDAKWFTGKTACLLSLKAEIEK